MDTQYDVTFNQIDQFHLAYTAYYNNYRLLLTELASICC